MKRISFFIVFVLIAISSLLAQDTLRVMHYNLLFYDMYTSWCTSENNNVDQKDAYLQTITSYYKPDIFTVNEMNGNESSVDRLFNVVFNSNDSYNYKRANYTGNYLVNMLYYNADKLALKSQSYISTYPRLTDIYHLYYKSEGLTGGDTIFLTCVVTHLKAGSYPDDAETRETATNQIMNYINNNGLKGNVLLMGDFNTYNSSEKAFQNLITPTDTEIRLTDPANAIGEWHNNSNYSQYHTQSTHTSSGCHSGGGMDDRFDFILTSNSIIEGTERVGYIQNSYWAFGQDGNRFNGSLISPTNSSLPYDIIDALYQMSDHLPVVLKLSVMANPLSNKLIYTEARNIIKISNPFDDILNIWSQSDKPEDVKIVILDYFGRTVYKERLFLYPNQKHTLATTNLPKGFYVLKTYSDDVLFVSKIIKR